MRPASILGTRGGLEGAGFGHWELRQQGRLYGAYVHVVVGWSWEDSWEGRPRCGPTVADEKDSFQPAGSVRGGGDSGEVQMQALGCTASCIR